MYGDDLRIQQFVEELELFKQEVVLIEEQDDLVALVNNLVQSGVDLLNSVCSLEKRIIN